MNQTKANQFEQLFQAQRIQCNLQNIDNSNLKGFQIEEKQHFLGHIVYSNNLLRFKGSILTFAFRIYSWLLARQTASNSFP